MALGWPRMPLVSTLPDRATQQYHLLTTERLGSDFP